MPNPMSRNPKHRQPHPDFHARKDERKRRALDPRQVPPMGEAAQTTLSLEKAESEKVSLGRFEAEAQRLSSYDSLFRQLGIRLEGAPEAPTKRERDLERRVRELENQLAYHDTMKPVVVEGMTGDRVTSSALASLWEMLGAKNQTQAIHQLKALLGEPAPERIEWAARNLGIAELEIEHAIEVAKDDAPTMERMRRAKAYVGAAIESVGIRVHVSRHLEKAQSEA